MSELQLAPTDALSRPSPRVAPRASGHPRISLVAAMLGFFVVALDAQIVNVALPDIRSALGGGLSDLQWIVTAYTLMFSALLLFGGTLSDRIGARGAYGLGMALFVAASAVCAAAPSLELLIAARAVQGLGAALITPTSLALIREAYTDAPARARAIAYWAMGGSVAAAAGPVLGGLLTQLDWRLIFLVNLPVGAAALMVLTRVSPSPRQLRPFDVTGQLTAVASLGGLTYGVIEGGSRGYTTPAVLSALVLALTAAAAFVWSQARGRHPMVPLQMFGSRTVVVALVAAAVGMAAFYGTVFVQSLYFQQLRGATSLSTGLLFLPMTALVALLNPIAARTAQRFGQRLPIVGGHVVLAVGLAALALLPQDAPLLVVALVMVPVGVGGSFAVPPLTSLLMDVAPQGQAGTASGVLNTARQVGGSLGVAAFGAVIAASGGLLTGLRIDYFITAAVVLATAAACLTLRRTSA